MDDFCLSYLIVKQNEVGKKIIDYTSGNWLESCRKSVIKKCENWWREFYEISQKLVSVGIRNDEFYNRVQKKLIDGLTKYTEEIIHEHAKRLSCDCVGEKRNNEILEDLEKFKKFLFAKKAQINCCEYPDVLLQEVQLRFELIKQNFEKTSAEVGKRVRDEFDVITTMYFDTVCQIKEQQHHKKDEEAKHIAKLENDKKKHVDGNHSDQSAIDIPLPTAENNEQSLFESYVDKIVNYPKLNCIDVKNITTLLDATAACLNSISKAGLNIETSKVFIARIIISKFNNETLQQYQKRTKQLEDQTLEDVIDFLGKIINHQKSTSNSTSDDNKQIQEWISGFQKLYLPS